MTMMSYTWFLVGQHQYINATKLPTDQLPVFLQQQADKHARIKGKTALDV